MDDLRAGQRVFHIGDGRQRRPLDFDGFQRVFGLRACLRDYRGDGFALPARAINGDGVLRGRLDALQVAEHGDPRFAVLRQRRAIDCRDHTGQRARLGEIKPDDTRVRVRTAKEHHMGEPGKSQIISIGSAPLQQTLGVGTRDALPCVWRVHQRLLRAASTVSTASTIA